MSIESNKIRKGVVERLGLDRFSALYVWVALIILFAISVPQTFLTGITFSSVLGDQSITGIIALGALVSLTAGMIDLSIASVAGFGLVSCAWLQANSPLPIGLIVAIVVLVCAGWGGLSAWLIRQFGLDSFIVTLGTGTLATATTVALDHGNLLSPSFSQGFLDFGEGSFGVIPFPAIYFVAIALVLFVVIELTPVGRRMLAVGGSPTAARLAGLRTGRIQTVSLIAGASIAGIAGVLLAAKSGVATDSTAPAYLLPAIAAVFLGSTQLKARFNVWGTVIAVFMLGTGIKGLQLMGVDPWVSQAFNGAALLVAVALAAGRARARRKI